MFQKDLKIAELIDLYGPLLSDRRREIIEAYYFEDLSLAEIADNMGISRQGVRDSIKKSESELRDYDDKLKLSQKIKYYNDKAAALASALKELCPSLPERERKTIENISEELRSLSL